MKGLANMKADKGATPVKAAPESAKTKALREVVEALKDGDVDSAAAALGVAISACSNEYEDEDEE